MEPFGRNACRIYSQGIDQLPKLSNQDVADLMIYFRSLPALRAKPSTFAAGEPEQGLLVFERSCETVPFVWSRTS